MADKNFKLKRLIIAFYCSWSFSCGEEIVNNLTVVQENFGDNFQSENGTIPLIYSNFELKNGSEVSDRRWNSSVFKPYSNVSLGTNISNSGSDFSYIYGENKHSLSYKNGTEVDLVEGNTVMYSTSESDSQSNQKNESFEFLTKEPFLNTTTYKPILTEMNQQSTFSVNSSDSSLGVNMTCHQKCLKDLELMTFVRMPESLYLKEGSSLKMKCFLPVNEMAEARMSWLFQAADPPAPQCSLTPEATIPFCEGFAFEDHTIDDNIALGYLDEVLVLKQLSVKNSGYYICMVELSCCSGSHTMTRSQRSNGEITVYHENYTAEIGFLLGITTVFVIVIAAGTVMQRRRRKSYYDSIESYGAFNSETVLHVPILKAEDDDDSFDESEEHY